MSWEAFRFAIIGPLLAAPPESGELQGKLRDLAATSYRHPSDPHRLIQVSRATIERWYYAARKSQNPVSILSKRRRADRGEFRACNSDFHQMLRQQYEQHPSWSVQLHYDNLRAVAQKNKSLILPSYSTVRRYMKTQGWRRKTKLKRVTSGTIKAEQRREQREIRSYEIEYVNGLWHLDFHHCSRQIMDKHGKWRTPKLLSICDDRSRLICHLQWYWEEDTRSLVHGFCQALQKRGLPRALMTDNGAAMTSDVFKQGLHDLSILHETTLPYSPYQNGKKEKFWGQLEGRFMAMLENQKELTLTDLNDYCQIWVEREYHHKHHAELQDNPLKVFSEVQNVGRPSPETADLKKAFTKVESRRQRKTDGTIGIAPERYEIPSAYRHLDLIHVRYAPWDMTTLYMIDPISKRFICRLLPWDKHGAADSARRVLSPSTETVIFNQNVDSSLPEILQQMVDKHKESGRVPGYITLEEEVAP